MCAFFFLENWKELFFFLTLISENAALLVHSNASVGTSFTALCVNISFWGTRGDAMVKNICQKSTGKLALGDHGMVQNLAGKTAAKQKQQQLNS
jgi:hypothetical protein